MARFGPDIGEVHAGPVRTIRPFGIPGDPRGEYESIAIGWNPRSRPYYYNDFMASTIALPLVLVDTSAAGTPTFSQRADIANGVFRATLDNTSEAQNVGVSWGDQRMIPGNKAWTFEALVSLPATLAANQSFYCGLIDDYNATPTSITRRVWFRINGAASANLTLVIEGTDNTNSPSTTTATALTADTPALLRIDGTDLGAVKFMVNDQPLGMLALPLLGTTTLQPFFMIRKASGVTTPSADIDAWYAEWNRS